MSYTRQDSHKRHTLITLASAAVRLRWRIERLAMSRQGRYADEMEDAERRVIQRALAESCGIVRHAARALNLPERTLWRHMRRLEITREGVDENETLLDRYT